MDPQLINEFSFSAANPSAYNLAENWSFSGELGFSALGLRMSNLHHSLTGFAEISINRDGSVEESTVTEQSAGGGVASVSKRKDVSSGDESSKIVSTSSAARREKISERMEILQDLVPGCNKAIGKALVLDEIINYVQSLQRQVEFLSMKLEAVNLRMHKDHTIEGFPSKDLGSPPPFDASGMIRTSQALGGYVQGHQPELLHMKLGGSFLRA